MASRKKGPKRSAAKRSRSPSTPSPSPATDASFDASRDASSDASRDASRDASFQASLDGAPTTRTAGARPRGAPSAGAALGADDDVLGRPIPAGAWTLPVVAGVLAASLLVGGAELGWRAHGMRPTADPGDLDLWAAERARASTGDDKVIVVIGKSRSMLDIDVPTLAARYPDHAVIQLAVKGRGAYAAFEDLALDEDFRGRILFGLSERDLHLDNAGDQREEVARARTAGPAARWDARLRAGLSSRMATRSYLLHPPRLLEARLQKGAWPPANFVVTEADRFSHADFARADLAVVKGDILDRNQRVLRLLGDNQTPSYPWVVHVMRVRPLVEKLRERGGDVAFVHLPVSDESRFFSERLYPKARFWDAFARTVPEHTVHFRDVPALDVFSCPDTSHLDERDAPRFTTALADELERRGRFPRSRPR